MRALEGFAATGLGDAKALKGALKGLNRLTLGATARGRRAAFITLFGAVSVSGPTYVQAGVCFMEHDLPGFRGTA